MLAQTPNQHSNQATINCQGYYNPITINTETADANSDVVQHPNIPPMPAQISNPHSDETFVNPKPVLMTNEGSAFPLVCETMDLAHIIDRKHYTDQISTNLANLSDPDAFRLSITEILDSASISVYTTLMRSANIVYRTHQAKAFLNKSNSTKDDWYIATPRNISQQPKSLLNVQKVECQ